MPIRSPAVRGLVAASTIALSNAAVAQDAVQWRVEDGGNGHWYQIVNRTSFTSVATLVNPPEAPGAYGATLLTAEENAFAIGYMENAGQGGAWIGLYMTGSLAWTWCDGSTLDFSYWGSASCGAGPYPNNSPQSGMLVKLHNRFTDCGWNWDDIPANWESLPVLVEWSADCNADGIVDYGQILAGEFADANGNNIPDCCESGVPCDPCAAADLDASGAVNGVDLAIILNTWGTAGGKYPQADIDGDGVVGGADLALVLGAWGECP